MTIAFEEAAHSRRRTSSTSGDVEKLAWVGYGSTDQAAMRAALLGFMPTAWDGLTLVNFDLEPIGMSGYWRAEADYGYSAEEAAGVKSLSVPALDDPLGPEFEFDLTAQQAHITQSIRTVTTRYDSTRGGVNNTAPAWAPSTAYTVGTVVKNGTNLYTCSTAGTSAGSGGPTGTTTGITDGTAKWDYLAAAGATVAAWAPSTAYTAGQTVTNHGFVFTCAGSGTSASTGEGPEGSGTGIVDGTCSWNYTAADADPLAPDFGGAIGVTRDRVTGSDIFVGHLEFSITAQYYPVSLNLIGTLLNLVGCFNQSPWYNFPTKTLLYLGCTGSPRPGNIWTLKHRFAASPNLRDVKVGSKITIPFKGGWDFLWCAYTDMIQTSGGRSYSLQVPYAAYVEQVYRAGDFSTLPIV